MTDKPIPTAGDGVALWSAAHPGYDPAEHDLPRRIERDGAPDMNTMLGRVWARICNNVGKDLTPKEEARRILEAMRTPTDEMIEAARFCDSHGGTSFREQYEDAIDAALKEP